jgi:hypothetical protein
MDFVVGGFLKKKTLIGIYILSILLVLWEQDVTINSICVHVAECACMQAQLGDDQWLRATLAGDMANSDIQCKIVL